MEIYHETSGRFLGTIPGISDPKRRRGHHLGRIDFLVRKFTALAEDREEAALLRDPFPRVVVVELKSSGFLWPGPA